MNFENGDMGKDFPEFDSGAFDRELQHLLGGEGMQEMHFLPTQGHGDAVPTDYANPAGGIEGATPHNPMENVARALEYLQGQQAHAFGAMFKAVVKHEDLGPPTQPDEDTLAEFGPDSIAHLDSGTEAAGLAMDQQLNTMPYEKDIAAAGLALSDNPFAPGLRIQDGGRFAAALQQTPEGSASTQLTSGLHDMIRSSMFALSRPYVPTINDEDYATYSVPRTPTESETLGETSEGTRQSISQMTLHASEIADGLEHTGANPEDVASLRRLHSAVTEGMLPHLSVALDLDLLQKPTTYWSDRVWTQFSHEDWNRISTFFDDAERVAPDRSVTLHDLASTFADNLQDLIDGNFQPTERPPFPTYDDAEDLTFTSHRTPEELKQDAIVEAQERSRQEQLVARLRAIAGRHAPATEQ